MKNAVKTRKRRGAGPKRPRGVILHRGRSPFNGAPYIVVALFTSGNVKTGNMIQTYILLDDGRNPVDAVHSGADKAVCGDCPMRALAGFSGRRCYVNVGQGPQIVHDGLRPADSPESVSLDWQSGRYPEYVPADHDRFFAGRRIRWGTYGEPVLIPIDMVARLSALSSGWTGYTHQWTKPEFDIYKLYFMASVHTPAEGSEANSRGWRYFRAAHNATARDGESVCPASEEAGKVTTCDRCKLCKGRGGIPEGEGVKLPRNIVISTHGGTAVMAASRRLAILD